MSILIPFALFVAALLIVILSNKPDTTTNAEIAEATALCVTAIREAEAIVAKRAPHHDECRRLLEQARYCLHFNSNSTMAIVSKGMIKSQRYNGVRYANRAAELALSLRFTLY